MPSNEEVLLERIRLSLLDVESNTASISISGSLPTAIGDGRKIVTTAGTRVALAASTECKKVNIQAESDNTGAIVVGGANVIASLATRRGTVLEAGDSIEIEIDDLSKIYIDSTVNGDGVTFTYSN